VDEECTILKKYTPACIFCGGTNDMKLIKKKNICSDCLAELKKL
jgi:transcriptional pleiotropic regulator of transition state genes